MSEQNKALQIPFSDLGGRGRIKDYTKKLILGVIKRAFSMPQRLYLRAPFLTKDLPKLTGLASTKK